MRKHFLAGRLRVSGIALLLTTLLSGSFYSAYADDAVADTLTPDRFTMPPNVGAEPGPDQPIPFSHAQHAGELRLPCMTCHTGAGNSAATTGDAAHTGVGLPPTTTCMNCHYTIATDQPAVESLARYHSSGDAVPWVRVYAVLAGVNWSHQPHTAAGVACETCHGQVTELEVMSVQTPVTAMGTCLGCHQASGASSDCVTCHAWPTDATFETRLTDR